ncbi:MAG: nucleoside triphosphate pyrophosphohydrolase [Firmicutes bacterium]|nr:nucleoside triphosphate pyrophosphohydrolase [Bacillota bacterium]
MSSSSELQRLVEIMQRLRGENGCPWDREQTHLSLRPYLLEEAYEVLEAIEENSPAHLREELGDLLLQVVFHAQIAEEQGEFTLADVLSELNAKLIRRHPHVFGGQEVAGVKGALANWEQIKTAEKEEKPASLLDGIPNTFPALMRAEKLQRKAAGVGFDWPEIAGPLAKVKEETEELVKVWHQQEQEGPSAQTARQLEEEFGDLLFSLVNLARFLKLNPELALKRTCDKFYNRFCRMEELAAAHGESLAGLTLAQLDALWEESKQQS